MVHRILTPTPFHPAFRGIKRLASALMDFAFPPYCLGCGGRVASSTMLLCFTCLRSADRADEDDVQQRLDRLGEARTAIDGAFALWIFDKRGFLQDLHQPLKYGNRPYYGIYLGRILGCAFEQTLLHRPPPDVVVPVPLHCTRLYERGYNQSTYLARGLASVLDTPVADRTLVRVRATRSQTNLSRMERRRNLRGAFSVVDRTGVAHRRILMIDDIITTGATCGAAASALREAGAAGVDLAVLAVARR